MAFNPYPEDDFSPYRAGQQTLGSPYLDLSPFEHTDNHPGLNKNLLAALGQGQGLNQPLTREAIISAYQQGFNRTPSEQEIQVHLRNPYGFTGFLSAMRDSNENRERDANESQETQEEAPAPAPAPAQGTPEKKAGQVGLRGTENFDSIHGYDANKFNDPGVNTLKYRAGRVFSRYAPSIEGLTAAMQDEDWKNDPILSKAKYDGGDKLDFGGAGSEADGSGTGVNVVDVLTALDKGTGQATGYAWQDQNSGQGGAVTPQTYGSSGIGVDQNSNLMRALMNPDSPDSNINFNQLLEALMQSYDRNGKGSGLDFLFG